MPLNQGGKCPLLVVLAICLTPNQPTSLLWKTIIINFITSNIIILMIIIKILDQHGTGHVAYQHVNQGKVSQHHNY